jgi:phosphoesterase RecJ-like protein
MTTTATIQWNEGAHAIREAGSILLVTHIHPDGDAIGSLLGLANALWARGKQVDTVVDGGVPKFLQFVPSADRVLSELTVGQWDVMISLDSSDEERTGKSGEFGRAHSAKVINLDHHATNTMFGDLHIVVPEAVAATEIVFDWLNRMGDPITTPVATALLTGLVTDTIGFRTSNVKPVTLHIAQALIEAGASLTEIMTRTLNSHPYSFVEIWKHALPTVQLSDGVISAEITQAHIQEIGLSEIPDTGLVSWLVSVDEAKVSALFKEQPDNTVEVSLRSKVGYDVAHIAFKLGGGGHKQASGATVTGTLSEVKTRVIPMLRDLVLNGAQ